jgi:hypothetical protein
VALDDPKGTVAERGGKVAGAALSTSAAEAWAVGFTIACMA